MDEIESNYPRDPSTESERETLTSLQRIATIDLVAVSFYASCVVLFEAGVVLRMPSSMSPYIGFFAMIGGIVFLGIGILTVRFTFIANRLVQKLSNPSTQNSTLRTSALFLFLPVAHPLDLLALHQSGISAISSGSANSRLKFAMAFFTFVVASIIFSTFANTIFARQSSLRQTFETLSGICSVAAMIIGNRILSRINQNLRNAMRSPR